MDAPNKSKENIIDVAGDIAETYRDIAALRAVEYSTTSASVSIVGVLALVVAIFLLLFAGIGMAWWLGEALHDMKIGFFIVGGFYAIVLIVVLAIAKDTLVPGIRNFLIRKIYEQD